MTGSLWQGARHLDIDARLADPGLRIVVCCGSGD